MEEEENGSIRESDTPRADLENANYNTTASAVSDCGASMPNIDEDREDQVYDIEGEDEP